MLMNDKHMHWVPVDVSLPNDGQAVIVRYAWDNWIAEHTMANGSKRETWRWECAIFTDQPSSNPNNNRPYYWRVFGSMQYLLGQQVTHWAAITDPVEE